MKNLMRIPNARLLTALICFGALGYAPRAAIAQATNQITNGSPVTGLAGDCWTSLAFKISVPADQTRLTITTRGSATGRDSGVTLYAKHGATPTTTVNDARSGLVGNNERISIDNPTAGDWFLLLYATTAYGGVSLSADYDDVPPAPKPPPVLSPASVFSDHMVLQRSQPVPIWGTAKPGDTITVTLAPQGPTPLNPQATVVSKADANGKWRVELAPLKASSQPMEVRITSAAGDPAVVMTDVLVGEVWLASGQSNMEWPMYKCTNGAADIAVADDSQLRLLTVPLGVSTTGPRTNMPLQHNGTPSKWKLCTPSNVHNFSGIGYYFARDVRKALGVPVGVIRKQSHRAGAGGSALRVGQHDELQLGQR